MYVQIKTDESIVLDNDERKIPVVTLIDEYGKKCQIVVDDHNYIVYSKQHNGKYSKVCLMIVSEIVEVLKRLPSLNEPKILDTQEIKIWRKEIGKELSDYIQQLIDNKYKIIAVIPDYNINQWHVQYFSAVIIVEK
jgi:hypothetical protein